MRQPAEDLLVYCRAGLVDAELPSDKPALLLEGAWDDPAPAAHWSLDQAIDGRFEWIDRQAEACAAELIRRDSSPLAPGTAQRSAGEGAGVRAARTSETVSPLWLGALELRYHLVKLLRVCAFFDHVRPLARGERVELVAEMPRDADYVDLMAQLCDAARVAIKVRQVPGPEPALPRFPPNGSLRRWLGGLAARVQPADRQPGRASVVLCGNPRVLDPLVGTLLARGARVWWLYDRFALRSFLAWRWRGVGQLVCNSSRSAKNILHANLPDRLLVSGVDLGPAARRYVERWLRGHGARQSLLAGAIEAHFRRLRPQTLVLDEDATPLARAAVAAARAVGVRSLVVQHGAPCCRFGFAPLAADAISAWGRSSRSQLLRWGVPDEQILVTGSPYHDRLRRRLPAQRPQAATGGCGYRCLLFASVPPRDERPDAVAMHWTRHSYAGVLRAALEGVLRAGCRELVVKLHPRAGEDSILRAAIAAHPTLAVRLVRRGRLERLLRGIDCVLSCASSAGVDATLSGIPVIQVLPAGASDLLSREPWGLAGIARTADEVEKLLGEVLAPRAGRRPAFDPSVFGRFDAGAAERIAEEILTRREPVSPVPEPHSSSILQLSASR